MLVNDNYLFTLRKHTNLFLEEYRPHMYELFDEIKFKKYMVCMGSKAQLNGEPKWTPC